MASKGGGSRAVGTDGSDFGYRQRVDTKYQKAAATRKSLKKVISGMFLYYPCMLAFALGPAMMKGGVCVPRGVLVFSFMISFCLPPKTLKRKSDR